MFSSGFGLRPPHLGGDDRAEPVQIRGGQEKMLGHASAAMTLDIYADLFDDDLEAAATAPSCADLKVFDEGSSTSRSRRRGDPCVGLFVEKRLPRFSPDTLAPDFACSSPSRALAAV